MLGKQAANASLEHHYYMVAAYLAAAVDAFAPTLELLPTSQELETTNRGLPKQPDSSRLASAPDFAHHAARCQVGNVQLGYAYELGFKLLLRIDDHTVAFTGQDGHDLTNLYNCLSDEHPEWTDMMTSWDRELGVHHIDHVVRATPTGTTPPRSKPGKRQKHVTLGARLGALQCDGFPYGKSLPTH